MKEKFVGLKGQVQSLQPFFHFFFPNSRNVLILHTEPNTLKNMQRRFLENRHKSSQKLPRSAAYILLEVVYS